MNITAHAVGDPEAAISARPATSTVKTFMALQGRIHRAVAPFELGVSPQALRRIAMGEVAQWLYDQDETNNPARLVEVAREAMRYVHERFPA
jgi:hypothetical protein